jgi:hypothetical protein
MTLQLDGVIYREGFNRETFLQTAVAPQSWTGIGAR